MHGILSCVYLYGMGEYIYTEFCALFWLNCICLFDVVAVSFCIVIQIPPFTCVLDWNFILQVNCLQ